MSGGIKSLLTGGQQVAYYPALAKAVGGIAPALFLQQIAHWTGKSKDGWVFRTQEELEEELAMSSKVQASARGRLTSLGVLEEKRRGQPGRLHYRVDFEKLEALLKSFPVGNSTPDQEATLNQPDGKDSNIRDESKYENKDSSRREADASLEENGTNFFTVFCTRMKEMGLSVSPEDRNRVPGNLKIVRRDHDATDEQMLRVVAFMVEARLRDYPMSPQQAWNKAIGKGSRRHLTAVAGDEPTHDIAANTSEAAERRTEGYEWLFGR